MNLLEVRDLAIEFRLDEATRVTAVKGISFDVPERAAVALVGESGSGKSVTALSVMGLLPRENSRILPQSRILYRGKDLLNAGKKDLRGLRGAEISMIFQEPMTSLNPVFTVGFQIGEVLRKHLGLGGKALRDRTLELLKEVGIPEPQHKIDSYPFQLSGGQQQRVMIAMAIACEPKLLIADEPTTALDVTVQRQIMDLIGELQERHSMAMLFITHDLALVSDIADHVVVMKDGEVREQAPASQLFRDPRDAYTRALLACRPPRDRRPRRLPVIDDFLKGDGPSKEERTRGLKGDEPTLLEARSLAKSFYSKEGLFKQREFKAVKGASFRVRKGKTLGVVGESGSGKTTVALLVARLHQATGGEVVFDGRDLLALSADQAMAYKRRIQIVFQNPYASLNPRFTVEQILTEPMQIHGIGADHAARRALAAELLDKVGLAAMSLNKYPHEFSGGQRQRIAIARTLTLKPELLICDESVSALDVSVQAQLLNLLQDLQDEFQMSYLFISHDLAVVRYMADEIYASPKHPYTQLLLSSMPGRAS